MTARPWRAAALLAPAAITAAALTGPGRVRVRVQSQLAAHQRVRQPSRLLHHCRRNERPGDRSEWQLVHTDQYRRVRPVGGYFRCGHNPHRLLLRHRRHRYAVLHHAAHPGLALEQRSGPSGWSPNQTRQATRWTRKATWTRQRRLASRRTRRSTSRCGPTMAPLCRPSSCLSRSSPAASAITEHRSAPAQSPGRAREHSRAPGPARAPGPSRTGSDSSGRAASCCYRRPRTAILT